MCKATVCHHKEKCLLFEPKQKSGSFSSVGQGDGCLEELSDGLQKSKKVVCLIQPRLQGINVGQRRIQSRNLVASICNADGEGEFAGTIVWVDVDKGEACEFRVERVDVETEVLLVEGNEVARFLGVSFTHLFLLRQYYGETHLEYWSIHVGWTGLGHPAGP